MGDTNTQRGRPILRSRVGPELRELVYAEAEKRDTTVSDIVRMALADYLHPNADREVFRRLST